ncbi:hypothetical protein ABIA35_009083 [Catenulispora sp. MAP12-49]|uniref:CBASS oligonucleotide cyclase n=1 Tax=Catenulispora sp. MAP12-49 TaxID=3156302 RepID=UPI0035164E8C
MTTVDDAFGKFRTRLETTPTENSTASSRQQRIREQLARELDIVEDFLAGSYRRHTKTKPLRDIDIMVVLRDTNFLNRDPGAILKEVVRILEPYYPGRVVSDRRAVRVDFGVDIVGDLEGEVISFDVVPAFADGDNYLIPDDVLGRWIPTNPRIHAELATQANKDFDEQWKPLIKMIKKWNQVNGSPVEPGFLLEVMALDIFSGPWTGRHPHELREFFATAADRIDEGWPDPASLGPDVSDVLDTDPAKMAAARRALKAAEAACTRAIQHDGAGRTGEALAEWQRLFGPLFAKS